MTTIPSAAPSATVADSEVPEKAGVLSFSSVTGRLTVAVWKVEPESSLALK